MRYFAVHVLTLRILEIILLKPKNFLTCPSIFSILFHFNVSTYSKQSLNLVFVPSFKIWPTFQDKVKTSRPPVFVPIETNVTPAPFWSGDHVAVVASVMTCTCALLHGAGRSLSAFRNSGMWAEAGIWRQPGAAVAVMVDGRQQVTIIRFFR